MSTEQQTVQVKNRRWIIPLLLVAAVAAVTVVVLFWPQKQPFAADVAVDDPYKVVFEPISTTEEEFDVLRAACSEYLLSGELPGDSATNVDVAVAIDEMLYADEALPEEEDEYSSKENGTHSTYAEYDSICFEDLLIVRFISDSGTIQVLGARFGDKKDNTLVEVFTQSELNENYFAPEAQTIWDAWSARNTPEPAPDAVSQDQYLNYVAACVAALLQTGERSDEVSGCFTERGQTAVIRLSGAMGITDHTEMNLQVRALGKSEGSLDTADRIYLRYELKKATGSEYVSLILKLNRDRMIFDADVI